MIKLAGATLALAIAATAYIAFRRRDQRSADLETVTTKAKKIMTAVKTYWSELFKPAPVYKESV